MAISKVLGGGIIALILFVLITHAVDYPMTPKADIDMQGHDILDCNSITTNMSWNNITDWPPCSSTGYAISCLGDSLTSTYFAMDGANFMEDFNAMGFKLYNASINLSGFTDGSVLFIDDNGMIAENNTRFFYEPDNGGKVAIGDNSNMNNVFQVVKEEGITDIDNIKALIVTRNTGTTDNNWIGYSMQTKDMDGNVYSGARILTHFTNHTTDSVSGDLIFETRHEGIRSEKVRISSDGNVIANISTVYIGDGGITDYAEIKTDGEINLHGTARVKITSWVDAGAMRAPGAHPATFVLSGLAGSWQFSDAAAGNEESISGIWKIPADMDKTEVVTMKLNWYANGASPGDCQWQLEYLWIALNEDETAAAQETVGVNSTASSTSNGMVNAEFTGIDLAGATDSGMFFKIKRMSAGDGDSISAATYLRGRAMVYYSDKLGKAL